MIIFDLDGTLWDSGENVAKSWTEAAVMLGYDFEFTTEMIQSLMGKTMEEIALCLFPEMEAGERKVLFDRCQEHENDYISEHGGKLFPDIRETLETLKASGRKMAIVSNCQTGYIGAFLKSMNMSEYFCDIEEWGNTRRPKGENIRLVMERNGAEKAVYVGDTQKDKDAACLAGIPFIHAAYGFGEVDCADAVINSFSELIQVLPGIYQ